VSQQSACLRRASGAGGTECTCMQPEALAALGKSSSMLACVLQLIACAVQLFLHRLIGAASAAASTGDSSPRTYARQAAHRSVLQRDAV
jgi:hypothetical protein